MTLTWRSITILSLAILTFSRGTSGGKGSHIIQAFLEAMRDRNHHNEPLDGRTASGLNPSINRPPFHGVYAMPLSDETKADMLRKMADNYPYMTSELATRTFNKPPVMNRMEFDDFDLNDLHKYVIQKAKRRPENYPSEMYPVQGGKQQLEVDLDNRLMAQERKIGNLEEIINDKETFLIDNEDDINETEKDVHAPNSKEEHDVKEAMAPFPNDVLLNGADPSVNGNEEVLSADWTKRKSHFKSSRANIAKRFWAADSLYKLRIPKSGSVRSFHSRTALPRFDPILYFIGLGK